MEQVMQYILTQEEMDELKKAKQRSFDVNLKSLYEQLKAIARSWQLLPSL
jgi:hypothetical protein